MILAHNQFETRYWNQGKQYIVGIDEVGRGAWAGPAVVGAVIFPTDYNPDFKLADSKLLSKSKREQLTHQIKEAAIAYSIVEVPLNIINTQGIGIATQLGFTLAVQNLSSPPDFILIDAFYIKDIPREKQLPIIKGDQQSISIAAASIIAKVYRDALMQDLHVQTPHYGFNQNVGYGTQLHREAIAKHGLSVHHRTSFNLEKWTPVSNPISVSSN